MSAFVRVLKSTFIKEMRVWKRNPRQLLLVILLPFWFWIAFNVLMGGVYSSGIDVALVVKEDSPGRYTNGLIEVLGEHDDIPPSMNLIQMSEEDANASFVNGDILLVITIPSGFEEAMSSNQSTFIHIRVNNMHEDQTKNVRMPVIRKLDIYYHRYVLEDAPVTFEYIETREITCPRLAYMAWTIAIYSIMFASMYVAGSTVTQEFEQDTLDEIRLSSQSDWAIYAGKMLCGVVIGYFATPLLLGLCYIIYGFWPEGNLAMFLALTIPYAFFCAAVGILLGSVFRNSVYLVPTTAISGVFYWLAAGGLAPLLILGLGFDIFDDYVPISNVYRSLTSMFVDGSSALFLIDFSVIAAFACAFVIIVPPLTRRIIQVDFTQRLSEIREKRRRK
jgi:hypothetical protein